MTPEERRRRVEHVVKMAELGIMAEPAYDREQWRDQPEKAEAPAEQAPRSRRGTVSSRKANSRRTA
jgi:hypothetical protein